MKNIKERLESILEKISHIEHIINQTSSISSALSDKTTTCPAILMHLVATAEQISKISTEDNIVAKEIFGSEAIKGFCDIRNFIAHDYDGVNMAIIEWLIRSGLMQLKVSIESALSKY